MVGFNNLNDDYTWSDYMREVAAMGRRKVLGHGGAHTPEYTDGYRDGYDEAVKDLAAFLRTDFDIEVPGYGWSTGPYPTLADLIEEKFLGKR